MISDEFTSDQLRMKIGRAYKHFKCFDALVVKYSRSHPYRVTNRDDLVNQRHVVRCEFDVVDIDIIFTLSDAIYSLRSGLDQLAWRLALLGNPQPSRGVMFPILPDKSSRSIEKFQKLVRDMPCEAVGIIKELQPYNRGTAYRDHPLWQLNELSNMDKHRSPVGRSTDSSVYFEPQGWVRTDFDNGYEISWPLTLKDSVVFKPSMPILKFGDPIESSVTVPLELTREQIAEIYNYVRLQVAPRFTSFFPSP
jgi:hypothetical protein